MRKGAKSWEIGLEVNKAWEKMRKYAESSKSVPKPVKVWESVLKVEKV